jgi:CheY-like chemotaxis protein
MTAPKGIILIADDNSNDVRLIEIALKMLGVTNPVRVTSDGREAIAYLTGEGDFADRARYPLPFILMLDWTFLIRSGLDVLTAVRDKYKVGKLCIVVMTSSLDPVNRESALRAGADLFLQKPNGSFLDCMRAIIEFWQRCETPV